MTESLQITDEEILGWVIDGLFVIEQLDTERPQLWFRGNYLKAQLNPQGGKRRTQPGSARYRWSIRFEGRQRRIMCSRLVFIYHHKRLIRDGCQIHHGDKGRLWDGISNLQELTEEDHARLHYGVPTGTF